MRRARLPPQRAITVWRRHKAHVVGDPVARRVGRAELGHGRGVAVVGVIGCDDPALAGHGLDHAQGNVIRLRAGAGQDRGRQVAVKGRRQSLNIVENATVRVAGVGVERRSLPRDRLDHMGVAVADVGHVVVAVQVPAAVAVPDPDPLTTDQRHRLIVEGGNVGAEQLRATRHHLCRTHARLRDYRSLKIS